MVSLFHERHKVAEVKFCGGFCISQVHMLMLNRWGKICNLRFIL